ncbi:MAG: O-antigen ligase family protein, partial [bacterium]
MAVPVVGLLLLGGLFMVRNESWLTALPLVGRTVAVFESDPSHVQRLQLWNVALSAIRARPFFGWGPENFDAALDRFYDPGITRYAVTQSFSDRAHNGFLDVAAAYGLFGLAAYLVFLIALGVRVVLARRNGKIGDMPAAALIGGLIAYAAAVATAFDTQISWMCLAVYAAVIASLDAPAVSTARLPATIRTAAIVAASALSVGLVAVTIPLVRGAALVHPAVTAAPDADLSEPARQIQTFVNPYRAVQEQRIANEIFKRVGNAPTWLPEHAVQIALAETLMRDAVARRPENFGARYTLANILLLEAMNGIRTHDEALRVFEEARTLAP